MGEHLLPYKPNKAMRDNARRALQFRKTLPPSKRFGTPVGLARARDIANNVSLSKSTILRMRSFLARHRSNYDKYKGVAFESAGPGRWSYDLWGGVAAISWTNDKIRRYKKAGEL